jgi:hypothetical protein
MNIKLTIPLIFTDLANVKRVDVTYLVVLDREHDKTVGVLLEQGLCGFKLLNGLLQENPHRFVMFPIKYHEVSHIDAFHA